MIVKSVYNPGGRDIVSIFTALDVLKVIFQLIVPNIMYVTTIYIIYSLYALLFNEIKPFFQLWLHVGDCSYDLLFILLYSLVCI